MSPAVFWQRTASTTLVALIFLCLGWEALWAPLRPGGSWLTLKAALLLLPLFGILRGRRYTYKWLSLFVQFYLLEGLVRATSESGHVVWLATGEVILATVLFVACVMYIRVTRHPTDASATPARTNDHTSP